MKRVIKATTKITAATNPEDIHPELENFEGEAYMAGYTATFEGENLDNVAITLKARQDADMMPKLTVWIDPKSSGKPGIYYFQCKAVYPNIETEKLNYSDDAEHWTNQWAKVARFITWMMKATIDANAEYED